MKSCANCGLCYVEPFKYGESFKYGDLYRCMRGVREPIEDLFTLGRVKCEKHVEVVIDLDVKR